MYYFFRQCIIFLVGSKTEEWENYFTQRYRDTDQGTEAIEAEAEEQHNDEDAEVEELEITKEDIAAALKN